MALFVFAAPSTTTAVTTAEAKLHLRVDADDEDDLISALNSAAYTYAETYTGRAIMTQTWDLKLDGFHDCRYYNPADDAIWLPKPPVTGITSISYVDNNGDTQTWTAGSTGYLTDLPTDPQGGRARIYPAYGQTYPTTRSITNAVTIRFVCGYASAAAVPNAIKAAMKLLIGNWYEHRTPVLAGVSTAPVPLTVDALLWPYKVF